MSAITAQHICAAAKGRVNESNLASVLVALDRYGGRSGGVLRTRSLTVQIARRPLIYCR